MATALCFGVTGADMSIVPVETAAVFAGAGERQTIVWRHLVPWASVALLLGQLFRCRRRVLGDVALMESDKVLPLAIQICDLLNYLPGAVVVRIQSVGAQIGKRGLALGVDLLKPARGGPSSF